MDNFTDITWEQLYKCWEYQMWNTPAILKSPFIFEEINLEYTGEEFIYGYDWLARAQLQNRKKMLEKDATQFLFFTNPSNKGTRHTLQMLSEAKTNEEIAAIWIYATAFELLQNDLCCKSRKFVYEICHVTQRYISERFCFWHHAMRKLIPEIYTNCLVREIKFESIESIIEIIALNAALIRYEYVPVLYSSLKKRERYPEYSVRI